MTSFLSALLAVGRTGIPEIVISAFIFRLAWTQHSLPLATLAGLLLWPGLANLWTWWRSRRATNKDP